jgi:hypothetical protein
MQPQLAVRHPECTLIRMLGTFYFSQPMFLFASRTLHNGIKKLYISTVDRRRPTEADRFGNLID